MSLPALLRSEDVARLAGVSPSLLWKWRREKSPAGQRLRACIQRATKRSTWWSTNRLLAAGVIRIDAPAAAPDVAVAATITASAAWASA